MTVDRKPLSSYISPQYWPTWLGLGLLRLICLLPLSVAQVIGRSIGRLAHLFGGSRRAIVRRNLELCFPELSVPERNALAYKNFESLGMMLIEMGIGRWGSDKYLNSITRIRGLENLTEVLDRGQGVILLSAHFTTLEISGRALAQKTPPYDAVYRKNRSDFVTEIQRSGRERSAATTIEKRDIKTMVRSLRAGRVVWYAPDQSYNRKGSEIIDFFGTPGMHTTATSTLAKLGKAVAIPYFPIRLDDGKYEVIIHKPLENFPSDDLVADTQTYLKYLEDHIRKYPEQYFWIHRKFKNLPDGYPDYYSDLDALK
jgi:KDO2-lipid IV(A) lauroyltransferase